MVCTDPAMCQCVWLMIVVVCTDPAMCQCVWLMIVVVCTDPVCLVDDSSGVY